MIKLEDPIPEEPEDEQPVEEEIPVEEEVDEDEMPTIGDDWCQGVF